MTKQNAIKVFEEKKVRTVWDSDKEEWYFSIVDVIAVLTDSPNPRKYWSVLKTRLKKEGSEEVVQLRQFLNNMERDSIKWISFSFVLLLFSS